MDRRSQKARMLAGDLYLASDPELLADYARAQELVAQFNATVASDSAALREMLAVLLGGFGEDALIRPPFFCDYGENIRIGARSFVNYSCTFLDVAPVAIGSDVQIGPNVQIYAATHPMEADLRRTGLESGAPVTVMDGAWIGGGAILCAGVTVGRDAVVGAGSVVTRDVPPGVFAAGNPARVIRPLPGP